MLNEDVPAMPANANANPSEPSSGMPAPTVHVVDDDAGVRDAFAMLLRLHGLAVECHVSGNAFLAAWRGGPGCLLLDLSMPGMSGLELQATLRERQVDLPIIVVTAHGDVPAVRASFHAGAIEFLEKPVDDALLLDAVDAALDRQRARIDRDAERATTAAAMASLSARERLLLERALAGAHNREIAAELGLSVRTIEVFRTRMMRKMGVRRLPDLVRKVLGATAD